MKSAEGAAELVMVTLLALCLLLVLAYTSRVVVTGQRLADNDALARSALGAAQAGLETVLARLGELRTEDVRFDGEGWTDFAGPAGTLADGASYTTRIGNRGLIPSNADLLQVESTGRGPDGVGGRVVRQLARRQPWLVAAPPSPLVVRGAADLSGLSIVDTEPRPVAAWLGGAASGTAGTELTDEPRCPQGVCAGDERLAALAPDFLVEGLLGRAPSLLATLAASSNGTVVWLEAGAAASGGTLGADDAPVLALVHGDLRLAADLEVHGLLVVLGDWLGGPGELSLAGALVVTGEVSGTPAARLRYAPAILERLQAAGPYVRVAGSWTDF